MRGPFESNDWFRQWMPYCLVSMGGPGHLWLPLNRSYKPLGMTPQDGWVRYEEHGAKAMLFARDPRELRDVWVDTTGRTMLFLYTDAPQTREDYGARLQRMMDRVVHTTLTARQFA
jgi:hypothetical protein